MNYESITKNIIETKNDIFYVPYSLVNTELNYFIESLDSKKPHAIRKISVKLPRICYLQEDFKQKNPYLKFIDENLIYNNSIQLQGSYSLTIESRNIITQEISSDELLIFEDFILPLYLKSKLNVNLSNIPNELNSEDILIQFNIEYIYFEEEFYNTLQFQKIEQKKHFEIEYKDRYIRKENIISHYLEKVPRLCDIFFHNKTVRKQVCEE